MARKYSELTTAERDAMCAMHRGGATLRAVAKQFDTTFDAAKHFLIYRDPVQPKEPKPKPLYGYSSHKPGNFSI